MDATVDSVFICVYSDYSVKFANRFFLPPNIIIAPVVKC